MGFAGTYLDNIEVDAQTFVEWKADYLKFDGCFTDLDLLPIGKNYIGVNLNKSQKCQ